jgi:catechol 2,3-dioxygenase-like lactoylglutathione lyase family enzyme
MPQNNIPGLAADEPTPSSADLCFITTVPLVEATVHRERCAPLRASRPGPRTDNAIQSTYIRDPDRNLIEISNY